MEKRTFPQKRLFWVLALALLGIVLGSFLDLRLSQKLYNGYVGKFGTLTAAFGELPLYLAFCFAGTAMFRELSRERGAVKAIKGILGVLLIAGSVGVYAYRGADGAGLSLKLCLAVCAVLCGLGCLVSWFWILKDSKRRNAMHAAVIMFCAALLMVVVVKVVKIPWGRPRMYWVLENGTQYFRNWWQVGTSLKKEMVAAGVSADAFKSFPSGHTASAAMLLLLPVVTLAKPQLRGRETLLLLPGVLYTAVVGFGRIYAGAHFLSDVSAGAAVSVLCIYAAQAYFFRRAGR